MLVWDPLFDHLEKNRRQSILWISPFIQSDAIERLLEANSHSGLQVITRWNAQDLISGVSNIEVYNTLKELGVPLYINPSIHVKLLVFEKDEAFLSTGNITKKGMGLGSKTNIEAGCDCILSNEDWHRIQQLLDESIRVDDVIYEQAVVYIENNRDKRPPLPDLNFKSAGGTKEFSRTSLPSTQTPELLWEFYDRGKFVESKAPYVHDLQLYGITNQGLNQNQFFEILGLEFRNHPFVSAIVSHIREHRELRFGAVNAWITQKCSDKPVPFRWELKPATNTLYNWLQYFVNEISWDVPGKRSMIIRWNGQ